MRKIRYAVIALLMLLCCSATSAPAQVSIGIGLPHVSIGINLPLYPELVPVPGYPVYYAPRVAANYFFYDGLYWVYLDDDWYASQWYNGPWWIVEPRVVPLYILRIPVRYYRHPPAYFHGWRRDAPPRWGKHWGHEWEQHRRGWDKWKRGSAPARAPLPVYQRQYSGDRYPRVEQQQTIRNQHYRYQPRDKAVRRHFQQPGAVQRSPEPAQRGRQEEPRMRSPGQQGEQRAPSPAQRGRQEEPRMRSPGQQREQRAPAPAQQRRQEEPRMRGPGQQAVPHSQPPHQTSPQQRGPAVREQRVQPGVQHERQAPRPQGQEQGLQNRGKPQEPGRGQGHREWKEEERGQGRGN